ncbi:hypothetical protein SM124_08865 [Bacillus sp. 31A1R]|uniref:Yip1 domain-containing protein n=1 Tax=Robertmurraya mangrovi TaxID=3098077 RepID=A0ABU5IXF6_9BACI|nr:hypothetical protein [Bacillus sp. 31A1R]MDZ5471859.1 hypothetical protein [Bacillus sp. 31A1R]
MYYQVQLLRSLFQPFVYSYQLKQAERIEGIWGRTVLLMIITIIISSISAYFGIGNEILSNKIHELTPEQFEIMKVFFALGQVLNGIVITALYIFFPSLLIWLFADIEYKKLVIIQLLVVTILLFEKLIIIPLHLFLGIDQDSSPFSFGVMAQYITNYKLIIYFLSAITLFKIWAIVIQYKYLKSMSQKSPAFILVILLSINLLFWVFNALFSYIQFEKLI